MVNVFEPMLQADCELCHPSKRDGWESFKSRINGKAQRAAWRPISVELIHDDEGKPLSFSDSPWLGSDALVFRSSALGLGLEEFGELLPLECDEAELYVFNPTLRLTALDQDRSIINRFSSGRIMRIAKYEFRREIVADANAFKISELLVSPTFVGDRFVARWQSSGLRGLEFKKLWSS